MPEVVEAMKDRGITSVANDHIELRWDPATGLVEMRFTAAGRMTTSEDAAWLLRQTEHFATGRVGPIGFLVDCRGLERTDPGWRATLADSFRDPALRFYVAWFNTSRLIRVTVEMFDVATPGIEGKDFVSETDARAWLRERGIG